MANDNQTTKGQPGSLEPLVSLPDSPKVKFESLPEPLRRQYYHQSGVHMHISAYIHGKIEREKMMELLCAYLVDENSRATRMLTDYAKWFGAPPDLAG